MRTLLLLILIAMGSALAVVYTKYRTRLLFAEVQALEQMLDEYDEEWGQLQLEQKTWAEHSRIERMTQTRLGMMLPGRDSILYLNP
jgi:cell division protein FtsL